MEETYAAHPGREVGSGGSLVVLEVGLVAFIALAVRLVDLGHPPFIDEMNHMLAAGSLLEDGTLTIHDGVTYGRARLFTWLVAGFFFLFGESLEVARLPALISGVLLVCVLFAWLRHEAGRVAAWTGGLLLCFSPVALYLSQWVRFYTLHALLYWLGAWGVYRLVTRADPARRRWWNAAGSLVALLLALHLQVTTVVGAAGLALFVVFVEGPRLLGAIRGPKGRWMVVGAVAVALVVMVVGASRLGFFDWLDARARRVDVWAIERADSLRFYHWLFTDQYGFLWELFPVAALVALARKWRPALLFALVFAVAVVAHSVAAWKAERYIFYALPAWFALWGLAAAEILPWLWRLLSDATRRTAARLPRVVERGLVAGGLLLALAFAASTLTAYTTTRLIYLQGRDWSPPPGHRGEWYRGHPDWAAVVPTLKPIHDDVDVLVGYPGMKAVHYLGSVDYVLDASHLVRAVRPDGSYVMTSEFVADGKIGEPAISSPGSLASIMECFPDGLVVAEAHVWGWRGGVPAETVEFIESNMRPVPLPEDARIKAYRWHTTSPTPVRGCEEITSVGSPALVP